jgi:hypothetical protein
MYRRRDIGPPAGDHANRTDAARQSGLTTKHARSRAGHVFGGVAQHDLKLENPYDVPVVIHGDAHRESDERDTVPIKRL